MITSKTFDHITKELEQAYRAMESHGLPLKTVYISAFLAEARDEIRGLSEALEARDMAEAPNQSASLADKTRIVCTRLLSLPEFEEFTNSGQLLAVEAGEIVRSAQTIERDTEAFGGHLGGLSERLVAARDDAETRRIINGAKFDTDGLVETNRALCDRLRESTRTVNILKAQLDEIRQMARTDVVTGLFNRRHFEDEVERLLTSPDAREEGLAMLFFDIDDFKRFNDNYGHPVGDMVLKLVARIIRSGVRDHDLCGRFGGDEFVILLSKIGPADARHLAERLRDRMASTPLRRRGSNETFGNLTISMGMTSYSPPESLQAFLERADSALLEAKQAGKNKLVVAA